MSLIRMVISLAPRIRLPLFDPFLMRSYSSDSVIEKASRDGELRVFIVSGEVSGDSIGSRLMHSLKTLSPFPVCFSGVGGSMMLRQGLKSLFPMENIAVMGIWELLPHLNNFKLRLNETVEAALLFQPHAIVTVDSKGFSFRFLNKLCARYRQQQLANGPVHIHYVAPSFWAWKGGEARLKGLSSFVDHILCILPFEEEVCRVNGLAATFVGHPILEDVLELNERTESSLNHWKVQGDSEDFRTKYGIPTGTTILSLLPGSRMQEVTRMLPIFSESVRLLRDCYPELTTVIHIAPNHHVENYLNKIVHKWPTPVILVPGGCAELKYNAFSASDVALCTSGTVALELQLARLPCVVAYRAHFLTEWAIRYKAKIPYISLPNILLASAVIPEALFQACTPVKLASLLRQLIEDEGLNEQQIVAAGRVINFLRPPYECFECHDPRLRISCQTPSDIAALTIMSCVKAC